MRISDASTNSDLSNRINSQRSRLSVLQERIVSGKRINRPSDDPSGAAAVLRFRTQQSEIEGFNRNIQTTNQKLTAADDALQGYEPLLDRARTLVAQGLSDTNTQTAKNALAVEIDGLRERILAIANSKNGDDYIFGGTRQTEPPFDPATAVPATAPTNPQFVQIEPGANAIATGVTADTIFADANSSIFTDLTDAALALRGTGDAVADRAALQNSSVRLKVHSELTNLAHAKIGATAKTIESAQDKLNGDFIALDERAAAVEDTDFAQTALGLSTAQSALEATLQVAARSRRSLFDFLS